LNRSSSLLFPCYFTLGCCFAFLFVCSQYSRTEVLRYWNDTYEEDMGVTAEPPHQGLQLDKGDPIPYLNYFEAQIPGMHLLLFCHVYHDSRILFSNSAGVTNDMSIFDAITGFLTENDFLRPDEFLMLESVRHWRIIHDGLVIRSKKVLPVMSRPGDLMRLSDGSVGFVFLLLCFLSPLFFVLCLCLARCFSSSKCSSQ
jgi:hypothetical protein